MNFETNQNEKAKAWYLESKYDFFWKNYNHCMNYGKSNQLEHNESTPNFNNFLIKYNKFVYASQKASQLAHKAALQAINADLKDQLHFKVAQDSRDLKKESERKKEKSKVEFEISEEMIKFYEESIRFQIEKDEKEEQRLKKLIEENKLDEIPYDQKTVNIHHSKKTAPVERAGLRREEELRDLYGDRASEIHLLETKLQMKYDLDFDQFQPKHWPSFPLRVKFE